MENIKAIYIKEYIKITFNPLAVTPTIVIFDNYEIDKDVVFNNGFQSEQIITENGNGVSVSRNNGQSFSFSLEPNYSLETREKVQQIFELTSKNYDCKFEFFAYNSFLDSFPPQLPNTGPDINTLTATFDNCVISFAPKSTEITNKGIGVKIGDNERLDIVVTKCAPTSKLFPCMAVNDTQFIVSASNAPAGGQTELFDFTFEVNPSQDVVSEIILFPQYGEYFIAPAPPIWGTGTQIENTGGSPFIYNTVIDPALFDSGDVVTIMFQPVSVQLSTGVHCRNTIVKGVIEIP